MHMPPRVTGKRTPPIILGVYVKKKRRGAPTRLEL
jgi:hypothetical protein